jgi:hypothetical protein
MALSISSYIRAECMSRELTPGVIKRHSTIFGWILFLSHFLFLAFLYHLYFRLTDPSRRIYKFEHG